MAERKLTLAGFFAPFAPLREIIFFASALVLVAIAISGCINRVDAEIQSNL